MKQDRHDSLKWEMTDAAIRIALSSVTPILVTRDNAVFQQGTGTLFQVGEHELLVTAAHVFDNLVEGDWIPHLLDAGNEYEQIRPVQLLGRTMSWKGSFDVSVTLLDDRTTEKLPNRKYLPFSMIDIGTILPGAFCVGGFPAALGIGDPNSNLLCGCMICTKLYTGSTATFSGVHPYLHVLIDRMDDKGITDRDGNPIALPDSLGAASGSPLLQTYQDGHPFDQWTPNDIRVVGVVTGEWREALLATRGAAVLACAYNSFPELQADFNDLGMIPINITAQAVLYG